MASIRRGGYKKRSSKKMGKYAKKGYKRSKIHSFKQTVFLPNWIASSTTADIPINASFSLGDLTNSSEFTSLFDQYKLKAVKFELLPKYSQSLSTTGVGTVLQPQICSVIDYDSSPLLTMADAVQYESYKITRGHQVHKRYVRPQVSLNLLSATGANVRAPTRNMWIDCSATNVLYRGVLGVITQANINVLYDLRMTYYLQFKNVR